MPEDLQKDTYAYDIDQIEGIKASNSSAIVSAITDGSVTKNPLNYIESDHFSDTFFDADLPPDERQIIHNHDAMIKVRTFDSVAAEGKEARDAYFRNLIMESEESEEPEEPTDPEEPET